MDLYGPLGARGASVVRSDGPVFTRDLLP